LGSVRNSIIEICLKHTFDVFIMLKKMLEIFDLRKANNVLEILETDMNNCLTRTIQEDYCFSLLVKVVLQWFKKLR